MTERRQEFRREEDYILAQVLDARVNTLEETTRVFAPTATQVAVHSTRLDESDRRIHAIEGSLEALDASLDSMTTRMNAIGVRLEGMATKLALVIGIGSLLGGGVVTLAVTLLTRG